MGVIPLNFVLSVYVFSWFSSQGLSALVQGDEVWDLRVIGWNNNLLVEREKTFSDRNHRYINYLKREN